MKIFLTLILLLSFITKASTDQDAAPEIKIEEIRFSRILPHAYCDQGKSSVKGLFPGGELLLYRRFGYLSDRPYCLIGYSEDRNTDEITVSGVFLIELKAFRFETRTTRDDYGNAILSIAEQITKYRTQNKIK